jgi:aminotransferase
MAQRLQVSPIKEMEMRSAKIPGVISLAQGVPGFDTPECIKRKVIEALQEGKTARYSLTPGMLELREAIEYDLAKHEIYYDFEKEIIVTAGSIEGISATFLALLEPGDEVLIPDPTYTSYQHAIRVARAVPVFVPLDESNQWGFNIEEFEKRITSRTRAILFCNPNNPTGTVFGREQLMQLAALAECHDLYILSDEVYRDFIYDERDFYSLAQFPSLRKRLIYIFSFSKTYAMTGWRIAYLATHAALAQRILGVHDALVTCAPVISQWGALAALELAHSEVESFRDEFRKRKEMICKALDGMKDWFEYIEPNSAYFVFPRFSDKLVTSLTKKVINKNGIIKEGEVRRMVADGISYELSSVQAESVSWILSLDLLYRAKVAVVPGVAFGPAGERHIRLCFGRDERDIVNVMHRINQYCEQYLDNSK